MFMWSISNERIQFLDLNIFKGDRFTETGLLDHSTHFNSTNTFQYLHFSPSHPRSVFKGLVKGEAIRSNTHAPTYHATLRKFRQHLLRNYPRDFVDRILGSITYNLRAPSLSPSPSLPPSPTIPRLVKKYSPHYTSLHTLLNKHWTLILEDPSLSSIFPAPPQFSFRKNPTLAASLVKVSLPGSHRPPTCQVPPIPITRIESRMIRCADKRCKVCPKAEGRHVLFSTVSETPYTFHETFTCKDTSLIYAANVTRCT